MSTLHLDSLEIKNFRCFEHLVIEKLGRVNLIVGRNSVGKTALLEAVQVYAMRADLSGLHEILKSRDESLSQTPLEWLGIEEDIRYLFYGRNYEIGETRAAIGSRNEADQVEFGLDYYSDQRDKSGNVTRRKLAPPEYESADNLQLRLTVNWKSNQRARSLRIRPSAEVIPLDLVKATFIPISGLRNYYVASLWDKTTLTPLETDTIKALQYLDANIEGYSFVSDPQESRSRYPVVKHKLSATPIPLRNLGEGMTRSLGMSLALVNAKDGILLIDEFESGLHHGVQSNLWRMIFGVAKVLNIQVFATTHSWDCVEAFQEAAAEDQNEEAMLISLRRGKDGQIRAVSYGEEELAIVTEQGIEVR